MVNVCGHGRVSCPGEQMRLIEERQYIELT